MYVARFEGPERRFATIAVRWQGPARSGAGGWAAVAARHPAVDVALRLRLRRPDQPPTLLLSTDARREDALTDCLAGMREVLGPQSLAVVEDAATFDALVAPPPHQVRVQYRGYRHAGIDVACDFRLYAGLGDVQEHDGAVYQVNWAAHRPDAETERQVLKQLARLDLERPLPDASRRTQVELLRRLLQPGWIGDEYLAFADPAALARWSRALARRFGQADGHAGFGEPPIEAGDFHDWLATGCPTLRDPAEPDSLIRRAAAWFDAAELNWLARAGQGAPEPDADHSVSEAGHVFISYATPDHEAARALCARLEADGQRCWIAPRDIERTLLPYTEAISKAIANAAAVAVLLSDPANRSVHVPREVDLALAHRRPVIPIRLEPVPPAGQLDYLLRTCQWLEAQDRNMARAASALLGRLASAAG